MKSTFIPLFLAAALALPACRSRTHNQSQIHVGAAESDNEWWENTVFYQIWPRSFYDTNGDGNGDFQGIIKKLDHLEYLGVKGIWLTPIFEAPSYHGYDFEDFYKVEQDYGKMEDFERLTQEAKKRGIRIITDMVYNHISKNHEWFIKSQNGDEYYKDFFIWEKEPAKEWQAAWGGEQPLPTWKNVWIPNPVESMKGTDQSYYYAVFGATQPDLNFRNKNVRDELMKATEFWLNKGLSGFRLDAARYLYEDVENGKPVRQADSPDTLAYWRDFRKQVKVKKPDAFLVGEVWAHTLNLPQQTEIIAKYYQNGEGFDACFDFGLGDSYLTGVQAKGTSSAFLGLPENRNTNLQTALRTHARLKQKESSPLSFYAPFIRNHDQERLSTVISDEERPFADRSTATLLLTGPGIPFIYYGEEIGMRQVRVGENMEHRYRRAPMLWDGSKNAGFSDADQVWVDKKWPTADNQYVPWFGPLYGQGSIPEKDFYKETVEYQRESKEETLLKYYKKLIEIRSTHPALRAGSHNSLEFLPVTVQGAGGRQEAQRMVSYLRSRDSQKIIVAINGEHKNVGFVTIPNSLKNKSFRDLLTGNTFSVTEAGQLQLPKRSIAILVAE